MSQKHKTFQPFHDRVLIRKVEDEAPASAILIPENAKEPPLQGIVLAVGPGRLNPDGSIAVCAAKVGELVMFAKYAGTEIILNGEELKIMRDEEIVGVLV